MVEIERGQVPETYVNRFGWSVAVVELARVYSGPGDDAPYITTERVVYVETVAAMSGVDAGRVAVELRAGRFAGERYRAYRLEPGEALARFTPEYLETAA